MNDSNLSGRWHERDQAQAALRKTADELGQAEKMNAIGHLATGVAHDVNNALTVIQSCAWVLEQTLDPDDVRHHHATEILRAVERAAGTTRQLLTVSCDTTVARRSISVDAVVAGFAPMLNHLVGEGIVLVMHLGTHLGDVPMVNADPRQLEQVLMNLAVNARDAMSGQGRLTIETQLVEVDSERAELGASSGGQVVLAVTDTGEGMSRETQAQIFEPFFTTKAAGKGTGLGLSIVHGIVTQSGGTISVHSEPGCGTTFRVRLPVASELIVAPQSARLAAPRVLPPVTVLVVDAEADVRALAGWILRDAGCQVIEAASADGACRICVSHEGSIDVAVLDVVLGADRCDRLARELRALRPWINVVLMSGYPAGALSSSGVAPQNLLAKPFTPPELRSAVAQALGLAPRAALSLDPSDPSDPSDACTPVHRSRVLVVDDDNQVRRVIARTLRKAELAVVEVDSGLAAITQLEAGSFDVILSDVHMPGGDGLDLLRAVRRIDLDVPVVLMSGIPDVATAAAAVEYGAFRYLTKPVDRDIVKIIRHAARAHEFARLRRDAFSAVGTHAGAVDRAGLEVRFEQALEHAWMAFQPIFDARTGARFGVEALVRSREPSMPGAQHILDAATQLGLLPRLGRRVRALSAAVLADRSDDLTLFVNLHPEDLADIDLVTDDAPLTKIAPRVILEITERTSLKSSPELEERLARLRKLGFRIAVDDIGAGYSGLTSFTELMPEVVKIDMSLVRDVHTNARKQRTIAALCRLCHEEAGCLVVGEGVETIEEQRCLIDLGCDLLQGYLLGRPSRELQSAEHT
jgi:EAL domain-containing protein (putative c-di-GMP-specific phosphodiesterase class I)/CheY-like chemotaxis protein/nitrogen-specific signal transduction histidine kinase